MGTPRRALFALLYAVGRGLERAAKVPYWAAAGTMRRGDLRAALDRRWEPFNRLQTDTQLMDWEERFYGQFLRKADHILLIGCGSGRDLIALIERGYRVDGLDPVETSIARARRQLETRGLDSTLWVGMIEEFQPPESFDAFVFSWYCYSYIPGAATRISVLGTLRDHLSPGGRILLTYLPRKGPARRAMIALARIVGRLTRSDWRWEAGDNIAVIGSSPADLHFEHFFTREEIEVEARAAGLTVVAHDHRDPATAVLRP